jgi:fructose/tagatose bisphosphate aldolase
VDVPLVLHGASSVAENDLGAAIQRGIRKINVGSVLKQTYFRALREASATVAPDANPYEIIGSGLENDVLVAGRVAMQRKVADLMRSFGSAGRAKR